VVPVDVHRVGFKATIHDGEPHDVALVHLDVLDVRRDSPVDDVSLNRCTAHESRQLVEHHGCLDEAIAFRELGDGGCSVAEQVEVGTVPRGRQA
jgi:hypothetical protein